jgi:NADPH-dependent 7-cyano-7-deazaguanine reductase QueF-like protein
MLALLVTRFFIQLSIRSKNIVDSYRHQLYIDSYRNQLYLDFYRHQDIINYETLMRRHLNELLKMPLTN